MFVDLDWPLNASSLLSASAELLVSRMYIKEGEGALFWDALYAYTCWLKFKHCDYSVVWLICWLRNCTGVRWRGPREIRGNHAGMETDVGDSSGDVRELKTYFMEGLMMLLLCIQWQKESANNTSFESHSHDHIKRAAVGLLTTSVSSRQPCRKGRIKKIITLTLANFSTSDFIDELNFWNPNFLQVLDSPVWDSWYSLRFTFCGLFFAQA